MIISVFIVHRRRRYSYDAIHNIVARARSSLAPGGYSRVRLIPAHLWPAVPLNAVRQVCHIAERSLHNVLDSDDNVAVLLSLHTSNNGGHAVPDRSPRHIKI
jgi:hypothetical protein